MTPKKVFLLIDGGFLRERFREAGAPFRPKKVEDFALRAPESGEELSKILYYDCAPYAGEIPHPKTGLPIKFLGQDITAQLAVRPLFAVRRGVLKFRGWTPGDNGDMKPVFAQKGVDMRIGLDIADIAHQRQADRILICTDDADMTPALKVCRRRGMQVVLINPLGRKKMKLNSELVVHSDGVRPVPILESGGENVVK